MRGEEVGGGVMGIVDGGWNALVNLARLSQDVLAQLKLVTVITWHGRAPMSVKWMSLFSCLKCLVLLAVYFYFKTCMDSHNCKTFTEPDRVKITCFKGPYLNNVCKISGFFLIPLEQIYPQSTPLSLAPQLTHCDDGGRGNCCWGLRRRWGQRTHTRARPLVWKSLHLSI